MGPDIDDTGGAVLAPDAAFGALGNETRIQILQALAEAEDPLAFSELRTRVGLRHGGQFSYHLDKLVGHFVRKTEDRYELRQAGRRVVEAVLSGAVTSDPEVAPTPIDEPCPLCGAGTLVAFYQERVEHYCTDCEGHYGVRHATSEYATSDADGESQAGYGYLGSVPLPPAGLQGRSPEEMFQASSTWGILELLAVASSVCPRCSAQLAVSRSVCADHESTDGLCTECGNRHAVHVYYRCANCLYEQGGAVVLALMANFHLLEFLIEHGINPVAPSAPAAHDAALMDYSEDIRSIDPFDARFTFTIGDDSLTLRLDDELEAVESTQ